MFEILRPNGLAILGALGLSLSLVLSGVLLAARRRRKGFEDRVLAALGLEGGKETKRSEEEILGALEGQMESARAKDRLIAEQAGRAALGSSLFHLVHQWRQPLNLLGLVIQTIELSLEGEGPRRAAMEGHLRKGSQTIAAMDELLESYSRFFKSETGGGDFEVRGAVEAALGLVASSIERLRASVTVECLPEFRYHSDRRAFIGLVMSLVAVSVRALGATHAPAPELKIAISSGPARGLRLAVRDNAKAEADEAAVFSPPPSTGEGESRNLYEARALVEGIFGGRVECKSGDPGFEVVVSLPGRMP